MSYRLKNMVEWWWGVLGTMVPALAVLQVVNHKRHKGRGSIHGSANRSSSNEFHCERVCTSKQMLSRLGAFTKDGTPDACVTVCGLNELDACADACMRSVCSNVHNIPNWNEICIHRCQTECARLHNWCFAYIFHINTDYFAQTFRAMLCELSQGADPEPFLTQTWCFPSYLLVLCICLWTCICLLFIILLLNFLFRDFSSLGLGFLFLMLLVWLLLCNIF